MKQMQSMSKRNMTSEDSQQIQFPFENSSKKHDEELHNDTENVNSEFLKEHNRNTAVSVANTENFIADERGEVNMKGVSWNDNHPN